MKRAADLKHYCEKNIVEHGFLYSDIYALLTVLETVYPHVPVSTISFSILCITKNVIHPVVMSNFSSHRSS